LGLLLAGCAASPKEAASDGARTQGAPGSSSAAVISGSAATGNAAATIAPLTAGLPAQPVEPLPNQVVDLAKQPANEADNSGQVCRQMLKPNTNSIITVCGTPAQWREFKAAEARQAEELLLNIQAGRH
jgi:hypothetical protein